MRKSFNLFLAPYPLGLSWPRWLRPTSFFAVVTVEIGRNRPYQPFSYKRITTRKSTRLFLQRNHKELFWKKMENTISRQSTNKKKVEGFLMIRKFVNLFLIRNPPFRDFRLRMVSGCRSSAPPLGSIRNDSSIPPARLEPPSHTKTQCTMLLQVIHTKDWGCGGDPPSLGRPDPRTQST